MHISQISTEKQHRNFWKLPQTSPKHFWSFQNNNTLFVTTFWDCVWYIKHWKLLIQLFFRCTVSETSIVWNSESLNNRCTNFSTKVAPAVFSNKNKGSEEFSNRCETFSGEKSTVFSSETHENVRYLDGSHFVPVSK